ncbi:hypothetical protein Ate02nite_15560 [Paractinoplanes tereljensis]|uniref:Uncharacterized protein n=1 Tax=Paractinoplanes tereljensis TaxID=571912 RepID=A0A919NHM2_9ACTN|nr:hypothetical protein Ate02nite_15560 [Actinoplanes tereljensis]
MLHQYGSGGIDKQHERDLIGGQDLGSGDNENPDHCAQDDAEQSAGHPVMQVCQLIGAGPTDR